MKTFIYNIKVPVETSKIYTYVIEAETKEEADKIIEEYKDNWDSDSADMSGIADEDEEIMYNEDWDNAKILEH